MADMDTYDNEPRAYDGMTLDTYTYYTGGRYHPYVDLDDPYRPKNSFKDRNYASRDRSRSPGGDRGGETRMRDEPMNGRGDREPLPSRQNGGNDESTNPGSNLFVTGIHPRLTEEEISTLFEKYGEVEKCNIMRDPHTRESRGFGFVKMMTSDGADAAKEALQGEVYEGRTLSIEKARRARPRTPTPGKYFGPPKRGPSYPPHSSRYYDDYYQDRPPGRSGGGGYRDRYDDRGSGRRYDDRRGGGRDRYEDRGYSRRGGDDYAPRIDRYASRDDRYGGERRGGGYGGGSYDRAPRGPPPERSGYAAEPAGGAGAPPARDYEERRRYD